MHGENGIHLFLFKKKNMKPALYFTACPQHGKLGAESGIGLGQSDRKRPYVWLWLGFVLSHVHLGTRLATCRLNSPSSTRCQNRECSGLCRKLLIIAGGHMSRKYPMCESRLNLTSFISAEMVSERRYILFTSGKLIGDVLLMMTTLQRNPTSCTTSFGDLSHPSRRTWPICGPGVSNSSAKGKGVDALTTWRLEHMSILYTVFQFQSYSNT